MLGFNLFEVCLVRLVLVKFSYNFMLQLLSLGLSVIENIFYLLLKGGLVAVLFRNQLIVIVCDLYSFCM